MEPSEVARLTGVSLARLTELAGLGVLTPRADGRLDRGDVHRVRLITAFTEAGIPLEALAAATEQGRIDFTSYPELHGDPGHPSAVPYGESGRVAIRTASGWRPSSPPSASPSRTRRPTSRSRTSGC